VGVTKEIVVDTVNVKLYTETKEVGICISCYCNMMLLDDTVFVFNVVNSNDIAVNMTEVHG